MLKRILDDFALIIGLFCNVDKTVLMQAGNRIPVIAELGFKMSDSIHILDMTISSDLDNLEANFETTINKGMNYWSRYNLSLSGRIKIFGMFLNAY